MAGEVESIENIAKLIDNFVNQYFPSYAQLFFRIFFKYAVFIGALLVIDFVLKNIINFLFKQSIRGKNKPIMQAIYDSKLPSSVGHVLALMIGEGILEVLFQQSHPQNFAVATRLLNATQVWVVAVLFFRALKSVELFYQRKGDYYKIVALNAISQTLKLFVGFIFSMAGISVVFGISGSAIITVLGTITAVIVLVFRDTILGLVTGIHVATSKNLKAGDWIEVPKYNLEGTIDEIDLLTTKIRNFDKTISTIPTYDLISSEIKNLQVMSDTKTRRIKRAIIFDTTSFKFLDDEMLNRLEKIHLIKDYIKEKKIENLHHNKNVDHPELQINKKQLSNIGVFRKYITEYLRQSKHIDQDSPLMVRQLEANSAGLPLEVYCFTNEANWERFEEIQANFFDHFIVAAQDFDLKLSQIKELNALP